MAETKMLSRVLTNSAVLAVSKVLERASGFIVGLLIANTLGARALGVYAAAWAIYGLMAVAGTAGAENYVVREISRDRTQTASYTVHLSILAFSFALVLMLVAQVVVRHLGYSRELEAGISVMLLALLPKVLNAVQEGVFVAHGRVAFQTLTRCWTSSAYVLISALLLARGTDVAGLLRTFVAMEYLVSAVYFVLINRFIARLRPRFQWPVAMRLVREIKAFTASSVIGALFARPEIVILSLMATERQVGLYSAAIRVAEIPLTLAEVFLVNVFPMMSETFEIAEDRFARWQTAAVRTMLAFSLLFAASCLAVGGGIIRILYGEDFGDAVPVLKIFAVNVVLLTLIGVFWRTLVARSRQSVNLALQTLSVLVRLGSGVLLIAPLAAVGAAISSGLSSLVHLMLLIRAAARAGAPERILHVGWRFALAAAGAGAGMWLLSGWLPLPATLGVGCLLYAALALVVGAITPEDRLLLQRLRASHARRRGDRSTPSLMPSSGHEPSEEAVVDALELDRTGG